MSERINERINIKTSPTSVIPHTIIWLLLPIEGIGVLVFIVYAAFHWNNFVAQSSAISSWVVWFAGLLLYGGLALLVVKVIRAGIDALLALVNGAAEIHQKFIQSGESKRNYQIRLEELRLEQMKATLEHERLTTAQKTIMIPPGHTAVFPEVGYHRVEGLALPAPTTGSRKAAGDLPAVTVTEEPQPQAKQEEEERPQIPLPKAPSFWEMVHLITAEKMPLCFAIDDNPRSSTYGQTIPKFGTMYDLLSLCVIGKPGRGKSVLLLYYICILCSYGAEIHVLDPQAAFKELQLLHGQPLPNMPATARIYYYSTLEEMKAVCKNVNWEIEDRALHFQPRIVEEEGKEDVEFHSTKHPLVILADELPIIAELDQEIKAQNKQENRARKAEGLDAEELLQVTTLIKTTVLAARKYNMYFIGASQSIDASIIPTKVSAGFNARVIFYNTVQKARMAGLEGDIAKRLLPVLEKAGPGMTIYDSIRWTLIGAIPNVTIEDVLQFFGISMEELKAMWRERLKAERQRAPVYEQQQVIEAPAPPTLRNTSPLAKTPQNGLERDIEASTTVNSIEAEFQPGGPEDYVFTPEQAREFLTRWRKQKIAIKDILRQMNNGEGLGNRYSKHASFLIENEKRQQQ